jgi:hypothetical protein
MNVEILEIGCSCQAIKSKTFGIDVKQSMKKDTVAGQVEIMQHGSIYARLNFDQIDPFSQIYGASCSELKIRVVNLKPAIKKF